MAVDYEIITKSDKNFFPGLRALIESLVVNAPNIKRTVIDCGLTHDQLDYCKKRDCHIQASKVDNFKIQECMKHYYTNSIYGFITADLPLNKIVVHLDADTILLKNLNELVSAAAEHGFAAVSDYPPLHLEDQVKNPECISYIKKFIPDLNLSACAFNAGVFATNSIYFLNNMKPTIESLIPIHNQLWSNDQALLNLAAFKANPSEPFRDVGYKFNSRPYYRRSPEIPPLEIYYRGGGYPGAVGITGEVNILHFIGKSKPWHSDYDASLVGLKIWQFYYNRWSD